MRTTSLIRFVLPVLLALNMASAAEPLPRIEPDAAGFSPERLGRLHRYARQLVDEKKYGGLVTLLVRDGKILDWQTFGERTAGAPIRTDDIFAIASLTKIVATVGTLTLIEEGRLGLNDPIADYLPEFKEMTVAAGQSGQPAEAAKAARPITVKHLLTHTAGFAAPATPAGGDFPTLAEMVRSLAGQPLLHQPDEAWVYGPATDVVGRLCEVVSGKPFDQFLKERIFDPLAMRDTSFEVPPEKRARQVAMDARQADGTLRTSPAKSRQHSWPSGSGGLFSTPADYVRFAQMLLNQGQLDGVRILAPKTVRLMTMDHLQGLAKPTKIYPVSDGFGLGVEVRTDVARSGWLGSQGTFGWNGATTAYCSIDPEERIVAMVWAQHTPNAEFGLYERFNTLVYQALIR
jgi:CubicO group peptidase (beta-lactamase class C family)